MSETRSDSTPENGRTANRRQVLARSGAVGLGIAFSGALSELFAGTASALGRSPPRRKAG